MRNVPKLRFKEFIDKWEEKKLEKELKEYYLGSNYKNSENITDFPLLKMGNLDRGKINLKKIEYIDENEVIFEKDKIKYGDLFFNTRNTPELVGKVAIWRNELPVMYFNSNLMKMTFDNNFFMNYKFNTQNMIEKLKSIATGTTSVGAIYTKDLLKLELLIPNLQEQEKISAFLSNIDKKISITEEKLNLFEEYKKGIMQKIFNQELRFKDENGNDYPEWEEKKLGDVIKYFNGNAFPEIYQGNLNEKYPFYKVGDMNSINNHKYMFDANNYISEEVKTVLKCKIAPKNTIIFPKVGAALLTNKRRILTKDSIFDNNILGVKGKENNILNDNFLYFFMQTLDFAYFVQEGALPSISKNIIDKIEINLPCLEEQQKIADFLSAIDTKIEKISDELENLKEFKKGLLQQMFV